MGDRFKYRPGSYEQLKAEGFPGSRQHLEALSAKLAEIEAALPAPTPTPSAQRPSLGPIDATVQYLLRSDSSKNVQPSSFRWSLDQPVDTSLAAQPLPSVNGASRSLFAPPASTPQPQAQNGSNGYLPPTNPNAYNNRSALYQPVTPQLRQQYGWGAFNYGE